MKTYKKLTLAFLLLILVVPLGCSTNQSDEWEKAYEQSQSLGGDGKYNEAIVSAKKALKLAKKNWPNDSQHSYSLNLLADLYDSQGLYAKAGPLFKQCLVIEEKNLGPNHPDVAATVNGLAALYYNQGKYAEAEPLYKRALAIDEKALGPDHPHVATGLNSLAGLYLAQGKYAQAEPLFQRALQIYEKALGPAHSGQAAALSNLFELYEATSQKKKAKAIQKRIDGMILGTDTLLAQAEEPECR